MKTLSSLLGGAVLATSVYAAEPTLHTTPDTGYSLVQGNADKALKVAYIVMGDMCPNWKKNTYPTLPGGNYSSGGVSHVIDNHVLTITVIDYFDTAKPDMLNINIYPPEFTVPQVDAGKGIMKREEIVDNGLDGRVNKGSSLPTKTFYNNAWDQVSFAPQFTYFQEKYIKALDAIIAVCEGKQ